jgi:acyl-CoA dehydrogenase
MDAPDPFAASASDDLRAIREGVRAVVSRFNDEYWLARDDDGEFPDILDSLNPERILVGVEAIGVGQDALRRAASYAGERIVFDRPIGQNQGIQHPLAERWMHLQSAYLMAMQAAWF